MHTGNVYVEILLKQPENVNRKGTSDYNGRFENQNETETENDIYKDPYSTSISSCPSVSYSTRNHKSLFLKAFLL